jgi:integrase
VELLGAIFSWHATRTDDFRSPIVRGMTTAEPSRHRVLADEEIRAVWQTTVPVPYYGSNYLRSTGLHPSYRALIRFLLLTGARRAEAAQMTWGEINSGIWLLPASRNKVGHDLLRPLSGAALAVLDTMPKTGEFVFSRRGGRQGITGLDELKTELDRASGVTDWVHHDIRRTARSLLSRAGVPSDIAELCLGHVLGGVRGVYDRHKYIDEKRIAFEKLATVVMGIVDPHPNVVAIHA